MASGVPKTLETLVASLIPPPCREEVLGDLSEKYTSPFQYLFLAMRVVPLVIVSRARRVTEAPVVFMQALLIYGCFLGATFYRDRGFLYSPYGLLHAALPLLPFLLTIVYFDIYFPPAKSVLGMAGPVASAALITFLVMFRAACGQNSLCLARTLPDWMNILGAASSLLLVSAVRILFRARPGVSQAAGPAHWLKQTAAPIAVPRGVLSALAAAAAVTFAAILIMSAELKPGVLGGLIAVFLILGPWGAGRRKD